ncbi:[Acyl-carrier-protein] S-malonyltransferase [Carnobacterium iners]|uniref:Malonyl CoA-acyl carrier protein transacylase n=1 Tax=Carnobacterium iners TaxID=1073423 RepID=A0A1X7NJT8_9LACT|nr:ACP S-malonyltransferase [Carnobacterium iners]SEK64938.1 [Acyl-carrier-protein] S-malonyltransferase [Carnobacterium iners]SMH37442.1 [Acyl-carrier-protein] S-malonyltransferase [Carnobacterium iners]
MKIAFVYSGQGAQYSGMGQDLYEEYEVVRTVFDEASTALHMDVAALCFEENDLLNKTTYTQPAILTLSLAIDALLRGKGIVPEVVAGLSLGEYSAFVKAEVLDFQTAVKLVKKRGQYMTEAVPEGLGAMSAVMGLDRASVIEACEEASNLGVVSPANYNMPGQIVIAGLEEAVEKAGKLLLEKGAKRVVPLQVSGPFHTSLLAPAAEQLAKEIEHITINEPQLTIVSNTTAKEFSSKEEIAEIMVKQVMSPVYWEDSVRKMIDLGVDTFIEVGPGKTLSSFIKKIDKSVTTMNVENKISLEKTLTKLTTL